MRFAPVQRWMESRQKAAAKAPESAPPYIIENEYLRVEASPQDGSLTLLDHRTGLTYTGLHRFVDGADCGDEYNYSPPAQDSVITDVTLRRALVEKSGISQTMKLDLEMRMPASLSTDRQSRSQESVLLSIQTRLSLTPGVPMLKIHTEVDNHAEDHRLRVHFSAPFGASSALFDGHFEIVERPIALPAWDETWSEQPRPEVPQRRFSALTSPQGGLMIANRGLPEIEAAASGANQSELALTLLRCVGWLSRDDFSTRRSHAGPFMPTPGAQMPGKHAFDYAVLPFPPGDAAFLQAVHLADAFQTGLRAVSTSLHAGILPAGSLPASASLVTVDSPAFQLSAVKAAEQPPSQSGEPSAAWIVRGYNLTRQPVQINLRPCQLPNRADLTNLAEEAQQALPVQADGSVSLTAGPCQIVTVQFIQPPSGAALS
jgi:alpha-mannosidase